MKAAACGTWLGDLISALIVTDMMLQDDLYPGWAPRVRKVWRETYGLRIGVFWLGSILMTSLVITVIGTDWITWDRLNRDFVASTGSNTTTQTPSFLLGQKGAFLGRITVVQLFPRHLTYGRLFLTSQRFVQISEIY